uniref:Uncharacterized protein n=1 Tax=Anguilla anguilla TaxID=7936 RepID=A0A0E9P7Q1_ANGAN
MQALLVCLDQTGLGINQENQANCWRS